MHSSPAKTSPGGPKKSGLIFIVDDNEALVELARTVLAADGYDVRSFTEAKAVLPALQDANPRPSVLVTDYDMGELNGLDLIVSAHKIDPAIKTVLLSGTIDGEFISRHDARVDRFLGKPYMPGQLKSAVAEVLQS